MREDRVLDRRLGLTGCHDDVDLLDLFKGVQARAGARPLVLAEVGGRFARLTDGDRIGVADIQDEASGAAVVEEPVDRMGQYAGV